MGLTNWIICRREALAVALYEYYELVTECRSSVACRHRRCKMLPGIMSVVFVVDLFVRVSCHLENRRLRRSNQVALIYIILNLHLPNIHII